METAMSLSVGHCRRVRDGTVDLYRATSGGASLISPYGYDASDGAATISAGDVASSIFAIYQNAAGSHSAYSNFVDIGSATTAPAAPAWQSLGPTIQDGKAGISVIWQNTPNNEKGFTIQRSTDEDFTSNVKTFTVSADATTYFDPVGTNSNSIQIGKRYWYRVGSTNETTTTTGPVYGFAMPAAVVYTARNMHAIGIDTLPVTRQEGPGARDAALEVQAGMDLVEPADTVGDLISDAYEIMDKEAEEGFSLLTELSDKLRDKLIETAYEKSAVPDADELREEAISIGTILDEKESRIAGVYIWVKVVGDIYVGNKLLYKQHSRWIEVYNGTFNSPVEPIILTTLQGQMLKTPSILLKMPISQSRCRTTTIIWLSNATEIS